MNALCFILALSSCFLLALASPTRYDTRWFLRDPNGKDPVEVGGWPWAKYLDDDQTRYYYFNQKTAELVYERPEGMDKQVTAKEAAAAQRRNAVELEQGWVKYFDDETGYVLAPLRVFGTGSTIGGVVFVVV